MTRVRFTHHHSSMGHGTSDQSSSSTIFQRHGKRRCEKDCLFEQDVSRFKRIPLISRQVENLWSDRTGCQIYYACFAPGGTSISSSPKSKSHTTFFGRHRVFSAYTTKIPLTQWSRQMFHARQRFEVSQQLLERAINVQSQLKLVDTSEA